MYSFTIHSWMISELKLSGNELLVYANIYQFSSLPGNYFTASLNTIAKMLNISNNTVQRTIKSLVDKGLITKENIIIDKVTHCRYAVNLKILNIEEQRGIAKMAKGYSQNGSINNNINNNINKQETKNTNNTNNIDTNNQVIRRGKLSDIAKSKEKKSIIISRMFKMLDAFCVINNIPPNVRQALLDYYYFRVKRGLQPEQWEKILEPLKFFSDAEIIAKVNNALAGGYMVLVPPWELSKINQPVDNITPTKRLPKEQHERCEEGF